MLLSDLAGRDPIRGLIYGVSGSAKTTLIALMAQYEELRPIKLLDFDLRATGARVRVPKDYWPYIDVEPLRDNRVQGEAFTMAQYAVSKLSGSKEFKTLAIDSATFAMRAGMSRVLFLDGNKPATFTPQLQHYMQQMSLFEQLISDSCATGLNVLVTCHEQTDKDELSGRLFKNVDLTGKMANRIPGYFNELWHTEVVPMTGKDPQYSVRVKSDLIYSARTSFRSLNSVEPQSEIWQKIIREMKEAVK